MAGRLLFVILMYYFHEILVQARHPPKLTVNSSVITETEIVTLNCWAPPSSDPVYQCYFYTVGRETNSKPFSCLQTLTGSELLWMSLQSSPAEVEVKCFYTVKHGDVESPSPHSDTSSITIQRLTTDRPGASTFVTLVKPASDLVEEESRMTQTKPTSTMTIGLTTDRPNTSTFVTLVKPASDIVEEESHMMQTKSTSTMTTGLTVGKSHASTPETPIKQTSGHTVGTSSNNSGSVSLVTSVKPASETWTWKLVLGAACFGGVLLLGLAFFCTKRRIERCSNKRSQASVTDDLMCMRNLDHGKSLPAGHDETYSVITSVSAADCPTGSEKLKGKEPQNEDSDIYHMYSTISKEAPPSTLKNKVYSTLQAH